MYGPAPFPKGTTVAVAESLSPDFLEYLVENPQAGDTSDGIAQWWLMQQRLIEAREAVQPALDLLVAQDWLVTARAGDAQLHYRLNQEKERRGSCVSGACKEAMNAAMQSPLESEPNAWDAVRRQLRTLSRLLAEEVARRGRHAETRDAGYLPGLVLHEEEILRILAAEPAAGPGPAAGGETSTSAADLFHLKREEEQCLLLCLACEVDAQYGKVMAYLQDDVTRRQPSVGLALDLFWGRERFPEGRSSFLADSALLRHHLIEIGESPAGGGALSQRALRLDDRIVGLLLDSSEVDSALAGWTELWIPSDEAVRTPVAPDIRERTVRLALSCFNNGAADVRPILHLHGRPGCGRRSLAQFVCGELGLPLLIADVRRIPSRAARADALWRLGREALLQPAALFLTNFDDLLDDNRREERDAFLESSGRYSPLTFLAGVKPWNASLEVKRRLYVDVDCKSPGAAERLDLWSDRLQEVKHSLNDDDVEEIAGEFHFTDGQIREALIGARGQSVWEGNSASPVDAAGLHASCRGQATQHLGDLAIKVEAAGTWEDLILPEAQKQQLLEIVSHVKRSQTVLARWGFADRFPNGCGVAALFEGTSGTGKTTAAGIIAAQLGLDLYKIDLAGVVNKYIGETEKNLSRIFDEARDSNTILFFDEAEALFAKRAEMVRDANDRYAGIETAHLLQRLETHQGIVILATNMKQNLDEAFVRRLRFIIHFPFPSDEDRERIWRRIFPAATPLASDLDFRWLARKLRLTAGHIKNISLRAAFLAVDRTGVVTMDCVLEAARREMEKFGKVYDPADYRAPGIRAARPVEEAVA